MFKTKVVRVIEAFRGDIINPDALLQNQREDLVNMWANGWLGMIEALKAVNANPETVRLAENFRSGWGSLLIENKNNYSNTIEAAYRYFELLIISDDRFDGCDNWFGAGMLLSFGNRGQVLDLIDKLKKMLEKGLLATKWSPEASDNNCKKG